MDYEEIRLLKQSEKSTVHLLREKGGEQMFIRKRLAGRYPIFQTLREFTHPCLPKQYDVIISEDSTTIIEEYIEGQPLGTVELTEKQFLHVVRKLCSVLEYLHGKGIIHRDVKPSNIILTEDGQVYLIDFDAARMPKAELEQDTRLLGTRGYAPPEQYGYAQTDERTDIYALGVTLEQLLTEKNSKMRYKKILRKCRNLDPDKRYQSVQEVRRAFSPAGQIVPGGFAASLLFALVVCLVCGVFILRDGRKSGNESESTGLTVLPAPGNPHWDGETGRAVWDNVLESGSGDEVQFHFRVYRRDTETPPLPDDDDWCFEDLIRQGGSFRNADVIDWNSVTDWRGNGFYYFTVSAAGDGVNYADSPFVVSDAFMYTGEAAPPLPAPTELVWKLLEKDNSRIYYATWSNLDDYEDKDAFNVTFYDETGAYVMNNTWTKSQINQGGYGGIPIRTEFLKSEPGSAYRFTVQAYSSRPNEYSASPMPDPVPEEYYSPWLYYGPRE